MTERYEVAVVGSGFAGSLLARVLAVLGYEVVRFTWRQVTQDTAEVAGTIRLLLRARAS